MSFWISDSFNPKYICAVWFGPPNCTYLARTKPLTSDRRISVLSTIGIILSLTSSRMFERTNCEFSSSRCKVLKPYSSSVKNFIVYGDILPLIITSMSSSQIGFFLAVEEVEGLRRFITLINYM